MKIVEREFAGIESEALRAIVQNCTSITRLFIAEITEKEVGVISIDFYSPPNPLFVYMIYVVEGHRKKGIGTLLLEFAERMAKKRRHSSIALQPHEIDSSFALEDLRNWYSRRGYSQREGDPSRMEKFIPHS